MRIGGLAIPNIKVFGHGEADALHHAAVHLPLGHVRVQHRTAINHGGNFLEVNCAGAAIHFNFHALRGKVVRAGFIAKAAVIGKLRGVVEGADADDGLATGFVNVGARDHRYRLVGGFRAGLGAYRAIDDAQVFCGQIELLGCGGHQLLAGFTRRAFDGIARDIGYSAGQRAQCIRMHVRIRACDIDVLIRQAQFLGGDLS